MASIKINSVVQVWAKDGKRILEVVAEDGLRFKAWGDSGITEASAGTTLDVDLIDKADRDGKMEKWGRVPRAGGGGFKGGAKGYTPRDYAGEERAKHPSFALSYAKDIIVSWNAAKSGSIHGAEDVTAVADKLLTWLTAHAPKSTPVTQDGWIAAIQNAGLGGQVKDAKLQRADMEAWYAQNPAQFIERVKAAISGNDLPW